MLGEQEAREAIVTTGRRLYERHILASIEGNMSIRLDGDRILATPSGINKGFMREGDLVVTDLDGDVNALKKTGRTNTIMVVHAHGDNSDKLHLVKNFKNCIGTTQTKPIGKIQNFGGFTDGDRCVFLANHFKAKKIILLGMDFGTTIGKYSKPRVINRNIKIAKLRCGKKLLEWLAQKSGSELYSTTAMKGFAKIKYREIDNIITSKNAF